MENPSTEIATAATSRRGMLRIAVWSVPAVTVASAAPAFAASGLVLKSNVTRESIQSALDAMPDIPTPVGTIDPSAGVPTCVSTQTLASQFSFQVVDTQGTGVAGQRVTFVVTGARFIDGSSTAETTSGTGGVVIPLAFYLPAGTTQATINVYFSEDGPSSAGTPIEIPVSTQTSLNTGICTMANSAGAPFIPGL